MGNDKTEAQAAPRGNLRKDYEAARSRSPLAQQEREAFLADRAKLLFGSYRRDEASDPDSYVAAVTLVLSEYPNAIVEFATDPRTGLQAQEKFRAFMPNAGEIKAFCEDEMRRAHLMAQPAPKFRKHEYVPPPSFPGCRTNVLVFADAPQFAAIKAFVESGNADERDYEFASSGIKVSLSVFENLAAGRLNLGPEGRTRQVAPTDAELRAMYGKREADAAALNAGSRQLGPE